MGRDYDDRYLDAQIHYDSLTSLAEFFGRDMSVHRHPRHLQIHFIENGDINFHIDEKAYHVCGPSLFLTPAAVPHSFTTTEGANGHVLTVHQSLIWHLFGGTSDKVPAVKLGKGICLSSAHLAERQQAQWKLIQQLWHDIKYEWQSDFPGKERALENYVSLLIIQIGRLSNEQAKSTVVNSDELRIFHKFTNEIESHFREQWLLPNYIQAIGVSESRLNQICQRVSNCSPKKLIRERLLQEIKRMLIFSRLTINEVSYQVGFSDPAYFSRFFKKQTGVSPLNYRKSQDRG